MQEITHHEATDNWPKQNPAQEQDGKLVVSLDYVFEGVPIETHEYWEEPRSKQEVIQNRLQEYMHTEIRTLSAA